MNNLMFWRGTAAEFGNSILFSWMIASLFTALIAGAVGYGVGTGQFDLVLYQIALLGACLGLVLFVVMGLWVHFSVCSPLAKLYTACFEASESGFAFEKITSGNIFILKFSKAIDQVFSATRESMEEVENIKKEAFRESRKTVRALRQAEKEAERASTSRAEAFVHAAKNLQGVTTGLNDNSERLFALMNEVTKGAVEQKDDLETAINAMEEITIVSKDISVTTHVTAENAKGTMSIAEQSADVVHKNLAAVEHMKVSHSELQGNMKELSTQAAKITNVIELIEDVADQTNLLALNAAIEAARAGDAGRGFAVVADEVRKLAERTVFATADVRKIMFSIGDVIKENVSCVAQTSDMLEDVYDLSQKSGDSLEEIVTLAENASAKNQNIAAAVEQQVAASRKMGELVSDISGVSHHTVDISSQASDVVEFITNHTKTLCSIIEEFYQQGDLSVRTGA